MIFLLVCRDLIWKPGEKSVAEVGEVPQKAIKQSHGGTSRLHVAFYTHSSEFAVGCSSFIQELWLSLIDIYIYNCNSNKKGLTKGKLSYKSKDLKGLFHAMQQKLRCRTLLHNDVSREVNTAKVCLSTYLVVKVPLAQSKKKVCFSTRA